MRLKQSQSVKLILPLVLCVLLALVYTAQARRSDTPKTSAAMRDLVFRHGAHVDEYGAECITCHAATKSITGKDDLLPGHSVCTTCHDVKEEKSCGMCHTTEAPKLSSRITAYSEKFNHATHIDNAKIECKVCHADLDAPLPSERIGHFPTMVECIACHTQKLVSSDCQKCHLKTDDLEPVSHKLDWIHRHGAVASASQNECSACHKQESCQYCHNGDVVFTPHPRNYISRHGQEAHLSDLSCAVCHEQRDFCNECHRTMNVLPAEHFGSDWANRNDGGKHSTQAKFDLESCMSCHDTPGQDPVCVNCHTK